MEEEEQEPFDRDSYYAILNVPKDASLDDIRRSYRQLAQIFHPDKADAGQESAQSFMKIQEAYEVLSSEEKRSIYDIYGQEGLQSGLELGEYLHQPNDIRREFERFKAQEKQERQEASVAHRGHYIFKVDACDMMDPYDTDVDHTPELISVATTNSVQMPVSERFAASVGCQVAVRKRVGGGSFVCGIKRILSNTDTVEFQGAIGLKQFAQVQFSRQLGDSTAATVAASYHPQAGLGLSLATSRKLTKNTEADVSYQVGPDSVFGLGISRRGQKTFITSRVELGASTGIIVKAVWQATASISLRMSAKFGTMGIELELGGQQRLSEFSQAGCSVVAGVQGIVMRPKFSRGGHIFEVPIMLSPSPQDYKILLAAYILPPTLTLVIKYGIVRPIRRHTKLQKALKEQRERASEVESALKHARAAAQGLKAVAARKLRAEIEKDGLVVVHAKYGTAKGIEKDEQSEKNHGTQNGTVSPVAEPERPTHDASSDEDETMQTAIKDAMNAAEKRLPPPWLDVTTAVRFYVKDSCLTFNKGYSKCGLIGFADIAIGQDKVLLIHYLYQGMPYTARIQDKEGRKNFLEIFNQFPIADDASNQAGVELPSKAGVLLTSQEDISHVRRLMDADGISVPSYDS